MQKAIKSHAVGPLRLRRSALNPSDCMIPSGTQYPCILKPILKNIPTQTVLSESVSGKEFEVHLEVGEGKTVYLPCSTLHSSKTMQKAIKSHAVGPLRLRRSALNPSDCMIPSGTQYPCILKPILKNIPTQTVLSESVSGKEFEVHLEVGEGKTVYLPCSTLRELQNERLRLLQFSSFWQTVFTVLREYSAVAKVISL
nr:hypothetical transcript [Hymenolepis microstoma]